MIQTMNEDLQGMNELPCVGPGGALQAPMDDLAHLFGLRTILARPIYLAPSSWLEHIPFAFWLVPAQSPMTLVDLGTDTGVSYFSLCQAAERAGLGLKAFAIQPQGNEYPADSLEALERHNAQHYSAFSQLVRSTPMEAARFFQRGSVDLLHIDGAQDDDALRALFDVWMPRLSESATLLVHGSNIRDRDIGAVRFVSELRDHYPVFEFVHGNGLAVIGIGPQQSEGLTRLYRLEDDGPSRQAVHTMFGRLGRACSDSFHAQSNADRLAELKRRERSAERTATPGEDEPAASTASAPSALEFMEVKEPDGWPAALRERISALEDERDAALTRAEGIETRASEAEEHHARVFEAMRLAAETATAERDSLWQEAQLAATDLAREQEASADTRASLQARIAEIAALQAALTEARSRSASAAIPSEKEAETGLSEDSDMGAATAEFEEQLSKVTAERRKLESDMAHLKKQLGEREAELREKEDAIKTLVEEREKAQSWIKELEAGAHYWKSLYEELVSSRTWKLTAPARKLLDGARGRKQP